MKRRASSQERARRQPRRQDLLTDFTMRNLSCKTGKGKTAVPVTPVSSSVVTIQTPIHTIHSYLLHKNKGVSRRITSQPYKPDMDTSKRDSAIWKQYGIEMDVKSKHLSVEQGAKTQDVSDQRRWSWINILAFAFFFAVITICGLRFLQMYNTSLYHIHCLEDERLELTTQLSSQTSVLSSLTTWIYKAELEIKSLKRSMNQVQTELTAVKKELMTRDGDELKTRAVEELKTRVGEELKIKVGEELKTSVGRESNHIEVDVLAKLLGPLADFAAEKNGGSILATPDTNTFHGTPAVANMFGLHFYTSIQTTPSTILMGVLQCGECWAFQGSFGRVVILLARPIQVSAISIEHIPEALSIHGNINSAPRHFQLIGTTKEMTDEVFLGNFEYHKYGPSRQTFYVNTMELLITTIRLFEAVEVRFLSNYGNQDYTCVYRVRIHGTS